MGLAAVSGLLLAAAVPSLPGLYTTAQAEVGAALELSADGRFRYQLDYGAVSESAEGRWASEAGAVVLTSVPMPVAPEYQLIADQPLPKGQFAARVIEPDSPYFDQLDVGIERSDGTGEVVRVGRDSIVDLPPGTVAASPLVPVIGSAGGRFALSGDRGHRLVLQFVANDLGSARFDHQRLVIDGGDLLLKRYDLTIRFERAKR